MTSVGGGPVIAAPVTGSAAQDWEVRAPDWRESRNQRFGGTAVTPWRTAERLRGQTGHSRTITRDGA